MRRVTSPAMFLSLFFVVGLFGTALAQEVTPETSQAGFVAPDPSECQIEPRALDSILALVATPASGTPDLSTPVVGEPIGERADAETAEAVIAIARESVSCFNAGDFLRQFAFYTDNGLRTIMPEGLTEEDLIAFLGGTPEPLPEGVWESVQVRDIMVPQDGRVTAYVIVRSPDGVFTTFVTFAEQDDGWIIDSDVDVSEEFATPTT